MPWLRCPACNTWRAREAWADAPGQAFPTLIVCPACGAETDVAEPEYRLYDPDDEG